MANSYFKFKQFVVHQEFCAMKVTTDACLFGAWCAEKITHLPIKNILDIGAGTGLLSLMLAQQNILAMIDAVEIDKAAAQQALSNIDNSIYKNNITVYNSPIQNFESKKLYDFIISNPPFFENDLKSEKVNKNVALHSTALSLKELICSIKSNLDSYGYFAVLLPTHRVEYFKTLALDFNLIFETNVKQTEQHAVFRVMLMYEHSQSKTLKQGEIFIKHKNSNNYSPEFIQLLEPYYLNL